MKCMVANKTQCHGHAQSRVIAQPFYKVPPTQVTVCDYHHRQFETERFPLSMILTPYPPRNQQR